MEMHDGNLFFKHKYPTISVENMIDRFNSFEEFEKFFKDEIAQKTPEVTSENIKLAAPPRKLKRDGGIVVDGESGCAVKFAKCCNPLPGDRIIGFVTKGYGISVHKCDCPNVLEAKAKDYDPSRWVETHWEGGETGRESEYEALLQIICYDRLGMLADVSVALADMRVSILSVNTVARPDEKVILNLKIVCKNTEHYNSIVSRIRSLRDVIDVVRGYA